MVNGIMIGGVCNSYRSRRDRDTCYIDRLAGWLLGIRISPGHDLSACSYASLHTGSDPDRLSGYEFVLCVVDQPQGQIANWSARWLALEILRCCLAARHQQDCCRQGG
jgi:hypothetical protein